jgi:hypothetical protein
VTKAEILEEIRSAFEDVRRGITLHETEIIDHYGTKKEREAARLKDTDRHWWEVRDEWIDELGGVGGLSFLDPVSFRYYVPAYMSYWLRKSEEPCFLMFHLEPEAHDFEKLFDFRQRRAVALFLDYVRIRFRDGEAEKALEKYWNRFFVYPA